MRQVGEHKGGFGLPRQDPNGVPVGHGHHVAVTQFVTCKAVTRDWVVVHVGGNEVIAIFGAVVGHFFEEEPACETFANHAALQVGKGNDDGVDVALGN